MIRIAALAMCVLVLLVPVPTSSQPAFDPATVVPSPMLDSLARGAAGGDAIAEFTGYVGPSPADTVRLYTDLTLTRFIEIPRAAILQQVVGSTAGSPVKLYVRGSTVVVVAARVSAGKAAVSGRSALARSLPGAVQISSECQLACSYCASGAVGPTSHVAACSICFYCSATGGMPLPDIIQ
jgi:hypothetical protein